MSKEIKLKAQDAKKYFPSDLVRFTDVSLYSTTPVDQSKYTADLLLSYYTKEQLKEKTLTDATACIGGNAWTFADYVNKVIAVELDPLHAEILKHNMKVLNRTNVQVLNKNYLDVYLELKQDIIFFDPPWGGIDYKSNQKTPIWLTNAAGEKVQLADIILGMLSYQCETLILKLPVNYPISKITKKCTFLHIDDLQICDVRGVPLYRLVVLSHLARIKKNISARFNRVGYKAMQWSYL